MNKLFYMFVFIAIFYAPLAFANDFGTVVEVSPQVVVENVPVQSCNGYPQQIQPQQPQSFINGGSVIGGVVGGILGSQFGGGSGQIASVIAGTGLGAYAGNVIANSNRIYGYHNPNPYYCGITHYNRVERVINYRTVIQFNGKYYVDYLVAPYAVGSKIQMGVGVAK